MSSMEVRLPVRSAMPSVAEHDTNTTNPEQTARIHEQLRFLGKGALKVAGLALAGTIPFSTYMYNADVNEVKAMLSNTHPYITENSPVPDQPDLTGLDPDERLATVNMPGFGLVETPEGGRVYEPLGRIGANWSLHYKNTGIDPMANARVIVQKARAEDITAIGLIGDSAGTVEAVEVAVSIEKIAPDIRIPFIVMDSPAVGLSVLRPKSRNDGFTLLEGAHVPGIEYSRYARVAAEMYLRLNQVRNIDSFWSVFRGVVGEVFDTKDPAATKLLVEQFELIKGADIENDFKELARKPVDQRPAIIFMGAANAKSDDVVNTPESLRLIRKWTDKAGLTLLGPYGIDDFYHGAQWRSMEEYRQVLTDQVVPDVTRIMAAP